MRYILFIIISFCLVACEKDITLDLDQHQEKIVVEGYIEQDLPPVVLLSHDASLYAPVDNAALASYYIKDAVVTMSDGQNTYPLNAVTLGGFVTYTNLFVRGAIGKRYTLSIKANGQTLTAFTSIPNVVKLDSLHFEPLNDTSQFGVLRCHLSDPDTPGNYYRFFTKRLGKTKGLDTNYVIGFNTIYNDQIVNGKSFDFNIRRGSSGPEDATEPKGERRGLYKRGDTIVLKWCSIDKAHFNFWRSLQINQSNNGNPFASPITIQSNISGGLGVWGGYAAFYDTLIAK